MNFSHLLFSLLIALLIIHPARAEEDKNKAAIARGRDLVMLGGCNDCHTAGYAPSNGRVPESEWLKGDNVGWLGPWGTTYPINLRHFVKDLSEDQWVSSQRVAVARPPMPWYVMQNMKEEDLRDIYKFIKSLPADYTKAPDGLPPGKKPEPPYYELVMPSPIKTQKSAGN